MENLKDHSFFCNPIYSKVQCSVRVLACSMSSRFGIQEQTGVLVDPGFGFWII